MRCVECLSIFVQLLCLNDIYGALSKVFMFLGGWFRVRHVSIKVLWWLALASAMRVAFRFLPSSCRLCC